MASSPTTSRLAERHRLGAQGVPAEHAKEHEEIYTWREAASSSPAGHVSKSTGVFGDAAAKYAEAAPHYRIDASSNFHSPRYTALQHDTLLTHRPEERLEWSQARSHGITLGYNVFSPSQPLGEATPESRVTWKVDPATLSSVSKGLGALSSAQREQRERTERALLRYDADVLLGEQTRALGRYAHAAELPRHLRGHTHRQRPLEGRVAHPERLLLLGRARRERRRQGRRQREAGGVGDADGLDAAV